ncbi:MAG: Tol-Pal system beta propeller repeat protein TolB, partial [Desulfuromonadales bacterium]|nr:Tol-Pal system beta propeller repeat protein TolB [Desulfuromonadales bacterium]NIS41679.1 Tol-Pal system beta propeller repeat protein TolB [Desulfuromonadales bacterium]
MRILATTLFALALFAGPAVAQLEISSPGQQAIPLALTRFLPLEEDVRPEIAAEINEVLEGDLGFSGLFDLVDPEAFLSDADKIGLLSIDVNFSQWRLLGAEALVKGAYSVRGDQLVIEARLFDVNRSRLSNGRRYVGRLKDLRRIAHAFADQILKALTGFEGPFNSRISYVSNRTGNKEIYIMDSDGYNDTRITDHQSIALNPDFSPDGRELIFTSYQRGNPDLFRKVLASGTENLLSNRNGLNVTARHRPGGDEMALTLSRDGNTEIYLLDRNGKIEDRLTRSWGIDINPS